MNPPPAFHHSTSRLRACILWLALVPFILGTITAAEEKDAYALIFQTGTLSQYKPGDRIVYTQVLQTSSDTDDTEKSTLIFAFHNDDTMHMTLRRNGKTQSLGTFPGTVGNPVNMYFLEKVIKSIASATGGSPFYIRNRFKDALLSNYTQDETCAKANGQISKGTCITISPFAEDPNRNRMGDYADIQMSFAIDSNDPAWLIGLHAIIPEKPQSFALHLDKTEDSK